MLLKVALALILGWVAGVLAIDRIGKPIHMLLLVGLMLLLLGVLKARDATTVARHEPNGAPRDGR